MGHGGLALKRLLQVRGLKPYTLNPANPLSIPYACGTGAAALERLLQMRCLLQPLQRVLHRHQQLLAARERGDGHPAAQLQQRGRQLQAAQLRLGVRVL